MLDVLSKSALDEILDSIGLEHIDGYEFDEED